MPVSLGCHASRYAQRLALRSLRSVTLAVVLSVTPSPFGMVQASNLQVLLIKAIMSISSLAPKLKSVRNSGRFLSFGGIIFALAKWKIIEVCKAIFQ